MANRILKYTIPMQHGSDVRYLQERLLVHGFAPGAADGIFGEKTLEALKAFQGANELSVDGLAGPLTMAALEKNSADEKAAGSADLLGDFLTYLRAQLGSIYVWGAQGEAVENASWIYAKETTAYNGARAVALYEKRLAEGKKPILAYDCSGLIVRFLLDRRLIAYDMSSRGLYGKCILLSKDELKAGDLVFRHNGVRIYHVGVYMGEGTVIECKGRDDGVVQRHIDESGERYWNRFGRFYALEG